MAVLLQYLYRTFLEVPKLGSCILPPLWLATGPFEYIRSLSFHL